MSHELVIVLALMCGLEVLCVLAFAYAVGGFDALAGLVRTRRYYRCIHCGGFFTILGMWWHGYQMQDYPARKGWHCDHKRFGVLFRWGSLWVGGHWSPRNRRVCINLVPCVTFWFIRKGGIAP